MDQKTKKGDAMNKRSRVLKIIENDINGTGTSVHRLSPINQLNIRISYTV